MPHQIEFIGSVAASAPLAPGPVSAGIPLEQDAPWPATANLTSRDRWVHLLTRFGVRRNERIVPAGLYALGNPTPDTPVFVTANYQLSFDALRSALADRDAYLLVLDTLGVNVWCAAGKGTFGTDELVRRIESTGLVRWISHRKLVLPQLGASGIAAHEVRQRSGFRVSYGPVRADDLSAYLDAGHQATPAMRRVTFTLAERAVLTPIEVVHWFLPMAIAALVLWFLCGPWGALASPLAILSGVLLFPLLMPWIPTRDFSSRGYLLGALLLLWPAIALITSGRVSKVV